MSKKLRRLRPPRYFDERSSGTRRRGWKIGWLLWHDNGPPWHCEHRWFAAHVLTWDQGPGRKIQFEIKTYKTQGMNLRSVDGSKRYVRFGVCL